MSAAKRYLNFLVLLFWGALFLRFWVSGQLENYLHPEFHKFVLLTGLGLIGLAGGWYWATMPRFMEADTCSHCCGGKQTLGKQGIVSFLILMGSFGGAVFFSSGEYNEIHLINRTVITTAIQAPSLEEEARIAKVKELTSAGGLVRAAGIDELMLAGTQDRWRNEISGSTISALGQVRRGAESSYIVRLLGVCCAADARPLGLKLEGANLEEFPTGTWVRVTGKIEYDRQDEGYSPLVSGAVIESTDAPRNTILY